MSEETELQIKEPPKGLLSTFRYMGPGFILSAAIVGSGELIATTALGAKAGFAVMWVILFGCAIKVGVQLEFGRHCICHGVPAFNAWNNGKGLRIFGLRWPVYIGFIYIVFNVLGQGGVMGGAATVLAHAFPSIPISAWVWGLSVMLALLVFHGRYGPVEILALVMNVLFVIAIVYCVWAVQKTPYAFTSKDLLSGFSFRIPENTLVLAMAAFGITGVGAGEIFAYPTWCVEKGYATWTGPRDDSPEWAQRARGWMRVMTADAVVSMLVYTTATLAFYILGAAVLHGQDKLADGNDLILQLSRIFTVVLGEGSMNVFLVCAFAVLFSTAFSNNAAHSRLWADFLGLCNLYDEKNSKQRKALISLLAWLLPISWAIIYLKFEKPLFLIIVMGIANTVFLPVVAYQALIYRYRETDPAVRPSTLYDTILWVSIISIGILAVRSLIALFG